MTSTVSLVIMVLTKEETMTAQEFRSEMILKIRSFDDFAYKDQLANPADYTDYGFQEWFELFEEFMQND